MAIIPKLKKLIQPVPIGNAGFFADDFLNEQRNSNIDANAFHEYLVSLSGSEFLDGTTLLFKNGAAVAPPTVTDINGVAEDTVSDCYIYLDNELLYFAGGNFILHSAGPSSDNVIILSKGTSVKTSRVFGDGSSKEMFEVFPVIVTPATRTPTGLILPASIDSSKQHLVIERGGITGDPRTALGIAVNRTEIIALKSITSPGVWVKIGDISPINQNAEMAYRITGNIIEWRGRATTTAGDTLLINLPAEATASFTRVFLNGQNTGTNQVGTLTFSTSGAVTGNDNDTTYYFDGISYSL